MLRVTWLLPALALSLVCTTASRAAVTTSTLQGEGFDAYLLSNDVIAGMIPTVLPGDKGWHPANPASGNDLHPAGLPAFTDGQGLGPSGLTGLLNDFPGAGQPAKRIQYTLGAPTDIGAVQVYSGNNGRDGRVFHTYTVEFSMDSGTSWSNPIYVQSHPSGTLNSGPDAFRSVLTQTFDPASPLATSVTDLRFDFYAVDNTGGEMRDPFDGVNPFTGADDTLGAAFVSPLIWEIDVMTPGQFEAIPEPSSILLLATGLGGLLPVLRRRR